MAKCQRNDVGSVVLGRPSVGVSFNLCSKFSGGLLRRKIIDTVSCGGSRYRHAEGITKSSAAVKPMRQDSYQGQGQRSECRSETKKNGGSEKLSELLKLPESSENEEEVRRKEEALKEFKRTVKKLQWVDEVSRGAAEVRQMAKDGVEARATLAFLGAIPPLVALLDSEDPNSQIAALYALLNLCIGNDENKAAIVKAGAVHKMLKLIDSSNGCPNPDVAEAIVANFLGLSALDSNKPIIGSSGAIPFLVEILKDLGKAGSAQAKQDSLRALCNLSILPANILPILETDLVAFLMNNLEDMEVSERILSILSNVISTPEGRKAISDIPDVFVILIDVLNWTDAPGCQEKASYILMVMAHKAYGDRQAMTEAGIVSTLLELTLLGSTLAQKRASRILECLRVYKGKQVQEGYGGGLSGAVSAPIYGPSSSSSCPNQQLKECLDEENMMSEEKKAVKNLVQQSLQNNMKRIVKRANLPRDFVPSDRFKSLAVNSTSKSLPF